MTAVMPEENATAGAPTSVEHQPASHGDDGPSRVSDELVMLADPRGARAEAIRALRTHLMAQHLREGRRALAICAASPGVGCTFVATNLAVALAQVGLSTLLIDADMRRPSIDRLFAPPRKMDGLSECLASPDTQLGNVVAADVLSGLSIMYAGEPVENPQELLGGGRFRELMDICLRATLTSRLLTRRLQTHVRMLAVSAP